MLTALGGCLLSWSVVGDAFAGHEMIEEHMSHVFHRYRQSFWIGIFEWSVIAVIMFMELR